MTRSVPGGQRGSSKDPAEASALWGNNSATFHHFIFISLYSGHTRHERKDRKSTMGKKKGREASIRELEGSGVLNRVGFE